MQLEGVLKYGMNKYLGIEMRLYFFAWWCIEYTSEWEEYVIELTT